MKNKNLFLIIALIPLILLSLNFISAAPTIQGPGSVTNPDNFYSPYETWINVSTAPILNDTGVASNAGLTNVLANFTAINASACGDGYLNLTYSGAGGIWTGNCTVASFFTNASQTTPVTGNITFIAQNSSGYNISTTQPLVLVMHNLGVPPQMPLGCQRFGNLTTNMSSPLVSNFSSVNYIIQIEMNGSCLAGPGGGSSPWDGYGQVMMLNFSSLNMSSQTIGQRLAGLQNALQVNITPPHQFGLTRIYVNETAFAELNTNATITLNNLPFSSLPVILSDNASRTATGPIWTNNTPWNITIESPTHINILVPNGNLQFSVGGFSGYNETDNLKPIITINSPIGNSTTQAILVNVTVNGTITQPTQIIISGLGTTYTYNSTSNSAHCTAISSASDTYNCLLSLNLSDTSYTLNVTAYDYGGTNPDGPGNINSTLLTFLVDTTFPQIYLMSPANGTSQTSTVTFVFNATDATSPLDCNVLIDGGGTTAESIKLNASNIVNTSIVTGIAAGAHNWSVECYDNNGDIGNNKNDSETRFFTVAQAAGNVILLLNGTAGGMAISSNSTILINATKSGNGNIQVYKNGTLIYNGTTPYAGNRTDFNNTGRFNITAIYAGNTNYTASSATWYVDYLASGSNQTIANAANVSVNENTTSVVVSANTSLQNITIPSTSNQTVNLDLSLLLSNGNVTLGTNNFTLIRQDTSGINYTAVIPSGTIVSGGSSWDGKITMPIVNTSTFTAPSSGTTNIVVDMGSSTELNFSSPVKIVIGGMAGKHAAWVRGTTGLIDISLECDSATVPGNLNAVTARECYKDLGTDLIIWTYHFTSFAAYTPASESHHHDDTTTTTNVTTVCTEDWSCSGWTACINGTQTKVCIDSNNCGTTEDKPAAFQACVSSQTQTPEVKTNETTGIIETGKQVVKEVTETAKQTLNSWIFWGSVSIIVIAGIVYFSIRKKK